MTGPDDRRAKGDDGAVLVEFAIIAPFLFLIIFAIIEFGWAFGQYLDVRHGAREGARLAAVNYADPLNPVPSTGAAQSQEIVDAICDRMGDDINGGTITLRFVVNTDRDTGDQAEITLASKLDTLTGFLDPFLQGRAINNDIRFRLERDASWASSFDPAVGPFTCP